MKYNDKKILIYYRGNIRNNLTIFGITGTFDDTIEPDIKLFDSVANMNSSLNNDDNDLAIVYNITSSNYQGLYSYNSTNNSWFECDIRINCDIRRCIK